MDNTVISLLFFAISLLFFVFIVAAIVIGGAMILRFYRELADLSSEVQYFRDRLDERNRQLEPCIGFMMEKPDEDEYGMNMRKKGRR